MVCVGIYNSRRELLAASYSLFGFTIGNAKLLSVLEEGGIVHTSKGTFIISVTDIS